MSEVKEWMNEWPNDQIKEFNIFWWTNKWMNEWINEWMNNWKNKWMN